MSETIYFFIDKVEAERSKVV